MVTVLVAYGSDVWRLLYRPVVNTTLEARLIRIRNDFEPATGCDEKTRMSQPFNLYFALLEAFSRTWSLLYQCHKNLARLDFLRMRKD